MKNNKGICPYYNIDIQGEPIPKQSKKQMVLLIFQEKLALVVLKLIKSLNGNVQIAKKSGK
ncbi:hypothetical protein [Bacillus wiedmannii]|uniref:hypothetical protein n=1 Tax=Bacillus wiedmannii TaxID=1890302 RepID=UPI002E21D68E|nr:hypothetical protein [Bacillus wiedmannii]